MTSSSIRFDLLFDADEYCRSGHCPWTFFAYPTSLAVSRGLPPDDDACQLLAILQDRAIDVAIWTNGVTEDTTYFACRKEDIQRLHGVLQELETCGVIEKDFVRNRSERLFASLESQAEHPRSLVAEIPGTIVSMIIGAFLGLMVGGNGLGYVSFVALCSFMGWIFWTRRSQSLLVTTAICVLLVIVWWPFGLMVRELGRGQY